MSEVDRLQADNDALRKRVAQLEQASVAASMLKRPAEDHIHQILVVSRIEGAGVHERFGDMYQSWFVTDRLVSDAHIDLTGEAIKRMTGRFLREFEERQVALKMVPDCPPGDMRVKYCEARMETMRTEGRLAICKVALEKIVA